MRHTLPLILHTRYNILCHCDFKTQILSFYPQYRRYHRLYLSLYMYRNYTIDFFVVNYGSGRRFMYWYLVPTIKYPYNNIISTYTCSKRQLIAFFKIFCT